MKKNRECVREQSSGELAVTATMEAVTPTRTRMVKSTLTMARTGLQM